jgi:hypothetical protein
MDNSTKIQKLFGIESSTLKNAGLSFEEFLCLVVSYIGLDIDATKECLALKGYGCIRNDKGLTLILSDRQKKSVETIIENRVDKKFIGSGRTMEQLKALADRMRNIYPEGYKYVDGRRYAWRDSTTVIAKRLESWFKKYPNTHTDEQIVEATKHYVESFNGNYSMMKVLVYFIMKNENRNGDTMETSLLKSEIENGGADTGEIDFDWTGELR